MKTADQSPMGFAAHVADKLTRYRLESVYKGERRDVVRLRPDDPRDMGGDVTVTLLWKAGRGEYTYSLTCPPWKKHHGDYYAAAAALWVNERRAEAARVAPAEEDPLSLPLPPAGPPCPECGRDTKYECRHVGGHGPCWRYICPALYEQGCTYFSEWRI